MDKRRMTMLVGLLEDFAEGKALLLPVKGYDPPKHLCMSVWHQAPDPTDVWLHPDRESAACALGLMMFSPAFQAEGITANPSMRGLYPVFAGSRGHEAAKEFFAIDPAMAKILFSPGFLPHSYAMADYEDYNHNAGEVAKALRATVLNEPIRAFLISKPDSAAVTPAEAPRDPVQMPSPLHGLGPSRGGGYLGANLLDSLTDYLRSALQQPMSDLARLEEGARKRAKELREREEQRRADRAYSLID